LPPAHRAIYEDEYLVNRGAQTGLAKVVAWLESWMHRKVARAPEFPLLELGAGSLEPYSI